MRVQLGQFYFGYGDEVPPWTNALSEQLTSINEALETIMIDTSALVAAAQRAKKDSADVLAVLTSVRNQNIASAAALEVVKAQLAAMPVDTAAQEAAIAGVVDDLTKIAQDSEDAVAANPAVPDMPPAPTP